MTVRNGILIITLSWLVFTTNGHAEEKRFSVPLGDSPSIGPKDARVTIVEFVDFQ